MIVAVVSSGSPSWFDEWGGYLIGGLVCGGLGLLVFGWLFFMVKEIHEKWAASEPGAPNRSRSAFAVVRRIRWRQEASRLASSPSEPIPLADPPSEDSPR